MRALASFGHPLKYSSQRFAKGFSEIWTEARQITVCCLVQSTLSDSRQQSSWVLSVFTCWHKKHIMGHVLLKAPLDEYQRNYINLRYIPQNPPKKDALISFDLQAYLDTFELNLSNGGTPNVDCSWCVNAILFSRVNTSCAFYAWQLHTFLRSGVQSKDTLICWDLEKNAYSCTMCMSKI